MFGNIAKSLFGTTNEREVKRLYKPVEAINALEPEVQALSDDALRASRCLVREWDGLELRKERRGWERLRWRRPGLEV